MKREGSLVGKIELKITDTGMNLLGNKKKELQDKVQEMQQYYDNGNKTQLNHLWILIEHGCR